MDRRLVERITVASVTAWAGDSPADHIIGGLVDMAVRLFPEGRRNVMH